MPMVSIVVPVYNAQKFIDRCIESIRQQSVEDFQVILVDDGSTDSSAQICKKICETDGRFTYLYQENGGPDMARKTGTVNSTGKYIMYVDADDYVAGDYLKHAIDAAKEYGADIVCSQITRFNGNRKWEGSVCKDEVVCFENVKSAMKAYFEDELLKGTYYAKLIDGEIMRRYSFIKDAVIGEDITAALYMIKEAAKIVVIPDRDYYYYWNTSSISHSGYTSRHRVSLENYIRVRDEILAGDYVDRRVICGYFAEYEMAVATAMSRNWTYDADAAKLLKGDITKYWKIIRSNSKTALYMKVCMRIYMISPKLFMAIYKVIYLMTGR